MRAIMPDEIQLSASISCKKLPLLPEYNNYPIDKEQTIFKRYLHSLTYDMRSPDFITQLKDQDVHFLKQSLTLLYKAYKNIKINLSDVEGVWPLLTFRFTNLSGLQLYLAFQKLTEPVKRKEVIPNLPMIKEQEPEFDQKKFFNSSNDWLADKIFMSALRVIEKYKCKTFLQNKNTQCQKILEILFQENVELLMKSRQFFAQYKTYKAKTLKLYADRQLLKKATIQNELLNPQQFMKGYVMSDPGDFTNILLNFERRDFIKIQSLQHDSMKKDTELVKSLYNQQIKQEASQKQVSQKKMNVTTDMRSQSTKRRIYQGKMQVEFVQSPSKTRNLYRRPPRFKFIERLYKIQEQNEKKKQKLRQIKQQKNKIQKIKQNFSKIQKITRRRLKNIDNYYFSDQEKITKRKKNVRKEAIRQEVEEQICIEQSVHYSSSSEEEDDQDRMSQRMERQSSDQITMKRKRPTKITNLHLKKRSFIKENYMEDQSINAYQVQKIQSQAHHSHTLLPKSNMNSDNNKIIRVKQCPDLKFLKMAKPRQEEKYSQNLQNLSMRILQLSQSQQIYPTVNISEYLWYLQSLEGKQIQKQGKSVCRELLVRQYRQLDMDLHVKIFGLYIMTIMAENKKIQSSIDVWLKYKYMYIDRLLQHCVSVTVYSGLSQILNNLTVSSINEDLSALSKTKRYFYHLFYLINEFDNQLDENSKPILSKFIKLLYSIMPTPLKIQAFLKKNFNSFLLNVDEPFMIGTNVLKFKLSPKQQVIGYTIAAFIFEQLILKDYVRQADDFESVRKDYLESFINGMKQCDGQSKEWIVLFNNLIKQFYKVYQPQLDKNYFSSLVNLIIISLQNLRKKIIDIQQQSREIKAQSQFLQFIYRKYLESQSKDLNFNTKPALLSYILVSTNISKYYRDIVPQKIETMIIYPRLLSSLWNYHSYRKNNRTLLSTTKKCIENIDSYLKNNLLQVRNKLVTESMFSLVLNVYRAKLYENLSLQNTNFTIQNLQGNRQKLSNESISYDLIRKILTAHFAQLDKFLDDNINFYRQCKSNQERSKLPMKKSQSLLIQFLDNFVLPQPSKSEGDNEISEDTVLKHSVSHYFFSLKFILEQNFFLKYLKIHFEFDILNQLFRKCIQILNHFFGHHPTFINKVYLEFEKDKMVIENCSFYDEKPLSFKENSKLTQSHRINEQLTKLYYMVIKNHFDSRKNMKMEDIKVIQAEQRIHYNTLANIYSTYIVSCLDSMGSPSSIVNFDNPMTRNIIDSIKNVNSKKVQKAICFLASIFMNLQEYIQFKQRFSNQSSYTGIKTMRSQLLCRQIKNNFQKNFILKYAKQIVVLIISGFSLKHSQQFSQLPVDKIVESFSRLQLVERNFLDFQKNQQGYVYFLYALNCTKTKGGLSDILEQLLKIGQTKTKDINNAVGQMITLVYSIMKQLLKIPQHRPSITLQTLKMLIFVLKWEQLKPQCVKLFLNEMQVFSKAQSQILKVAVTQKNVQTILQLFQAIERCKYNYFKIKQKQNEYIDQLFKQQKFKQKQREFCEEIQKILRCLHQICNSQSLYVRKAMEITRQIIEKFIQPVLKWDTTQSTKLTKRVHLFYELLSMSRKERSIYQNIVMTNKEAFKKLVRLHRPSQQINNFQQFLQKSMIGLHSNFLQLKALISGLMRQNVLCGSKKEYFVRVISRLKSTMMLAKANPFLIEWCLQELNRLNESDKIKEELSSWMDLQQ